MCASGPELPMLQRFLVSAGVVALAEIGDKTQLLSLVLAARRTKQMWVLRTLCDAASGRRLATTPGGAGL